MYFYLEVRCLSREKVLYMNIMFYKDIIINYFNISNLKIINHFTLLILNFKIIVKLRDKKILANLI